MQDLPIKTVFVDNADASRKAAWSDLQNALGEGMATITMTVPDRRGDVPNTMDFAMRISPEGVDAKQVEAAVEELVAHWRHAFEEMLNRRWSLNDNPYALATFVKGMVIVHVETLGWEIDNISVEMAEGEPWEEEMACAILRPLPESNHAALGATLPCDIPHKDKLDAAINEAAASEGHEGLGPFRWVPAPVEHGNLDVIDA